MIHYFQYCIVRFVAYPQSDEFVNVGIVVHCPKTGYFNFKLTDNTQRIGEFFSNFDIEIFMDVKKYYQAELLRRKNMIDSVESTHEKKDLSNELFSELIKPRESLIRYSGMRVIYGNTDETLDKLFKSYVEV